MAKHARRPQRGTPLRHPDDDARTGQAVRRMFDSVAHRYDFLNHFLSAGRDIAWRRAAAGALREIVARPGSVALDVCCGTGDLAFQLARLSGGAVLGADFSRPMVRRAAKKSRKLKRPPAFMEADAAKLPFPDNSLDAVTIGFGFRNLANYARGLQEMRRVLKRGGTLAILEFSRIHAPVIGPVFRFYFRRLLPRIGTLISGVPGPYRYLPDSVKRFPDQESLLGLMRQAGFKNVRYKNFFIGAAALHLGEK